MSEEHKDIELSQNFWCVRLMIACLVSAAISTTSVFILMKSGLNYHDERFQKLDESCQALESKITAINENMSEIETTIETLKSEWKSAKKNSSYLYTTISSLQKDVKMIKEKLNIETEKIDAQIDKMLPEKRTFLDAFENLIKDGAPFESFLESNAAKVDMSKYHFAKDLIKLSKQNIKSLADLKKDYTAVGKVVFQTNFEESFWERQKRIIKEKISEAIKIRKFDKDSAPIDDINSENDKTKFEKVGKFLADEKYAEAYKILNSIKIENEIFSNFFADVKKRMQLEETFNEFKKEFLQIEATNVDHTSHTAAQ